MTSRPTFGSASTNRVDPSALQLKVFTSPTRPIRGEDNRTFSPTTSTLIYGETDAVLVDSQ